MTNPVSMTGLGPATPSAQALSKTNSQSAEIGRRFEQMLWAEMLSHAGLEEALTRSGGEAASSFSRYMIEAIAKDISEKHPMGLGSAASASVYGYDASIFAQGKKNHE